jgi:hypothetical protein
MSLYVKVQQAHKSDKVSQVQALCCGIYTAINGGLLLGMLFNIRTEWVEISSIKQLSSLVFELTANLT